MTAEFSLRHESPLTTQNALAHLPPLLLFYFLQYNLLHQQLPAYAPGIAVGSLAALAALYGIARFQYAHRRRARYNACSYAALYQASRQEQWRPLCKRQAR